MKPTDWGARLSPALLLFVLILAVAGGVAACAAPGPAADDSGLQITLLYSRGGEIMRVRLADAAGAAVTDAVVSLEGNMNHAGMVPVVAEGVTDDADGSADGQYTLPFAFSMLGDWILTVTVEQTDGTAVKRDIDAQVTSESVTIAGTLQTETPGGELQVTDVRARPAPLAGGTGAVYLTVVNGTAKDEQLAAVSSPVAEAVELHETVDDNGVMRMRHEPEGFAIPAGGTLQLAPGGKHVMLIGLAAPLAVGDTITLTLTFAHAGEKVIQAPVVEIEGSGQSPMHASDGDDAHMEHQPGASMTPTPAEEHDQEHDHGTGN